MNPGSDAGPSVAFLCNDALLAERCRLAVSRDTDWRFSILRSTTELEQPVTTYDLLIVPIDLLSQRAHGSTTVAYGPPEHLRTAFLLSCRDYLRVPWTPDELIVRGEKALDRDVLRIAGKTLRFDPESIEHAGRTIPLRYGEYEVLRLLARSDDGIVSRDELRAVFGYPAHDSRSIDMHVSRVRRKLETLVPLHGRGMIRAIRGLGYQLMT